MTDACSWCDQNSEFNDVVWWCEIVVLFLWSKVKQRNDRRTFCLMIRMTFAFAKRKWLHTIYRHCYSGVRETNSTAQLKGDEKGTHQNWGRQSPGWCVMGSICATWLFHICHCLLSQPTHIHASTAPPTPTSAKWLTHLSLFSATCSNIWFQICFHSIFWETHWAQKGGKMQTQWHGCWV